MQERARESKTSKEGDIPFRGFRSCQSLTSSHTFRDEDSVAEELSMTTEAFASLGRFGMVQLAMTTRGALFSYPWGPLPPRAATECGFHFHVSIWAIFGRSCWRSKISSSGSAAVRSSGQACQAIAAARDGSHSTRRDSLHSVMLLYMSVYHP